MTTGSYRIFFSNLGYARYINGSLRHHLVYVHRYFSCPRKLQLKALEELARIIAKHQPDLCGLLEIDSGSLNNRYLNQILPLMEMTGYPWCVAHNKYGRLSELQDIAISQGKCGALMGREPIAYEPDWLSCGVKRLLYRVHPFPSLTVLLGHFSLRPNVRRQQFDEVISRMKHIRGEVMLIGDFNVYQGWGELQPFLEEGFEILNVPEESTFRFSGYQSTIDLCLASPGIAEDCRIEIIPQEFSDHHGVLIDIGR